MSINSKTIAIKSINLKKKKKRKKKMMKNTNSIIKKKRKMRATMKVSGLKKKEEIRHWLSNPSWDKSKHQFPSVIGQHMQTLLHSKI